MARRERRRGVRGIVWGGVVLLLGAVLVLPNPLRDWGLRHVGLGLDVGTTVPEPVDYVLSLGGGEEIRPFVGAALVKAGRAEKALVLQVKGGPDVEDGIKPPLQEIIRDVYLVRGVSREELVFLDGSPNTTWDESFAARRFLKNQAEPVRLAVVTHDFHTRRVRWVFRQTLKDLPVELVMISAPSERFRLESWWTTKSGATTVIPEYMKLAAYHVQYGNGLWWLLAVGGIAGWLFLRRGRAGKLAKTNGHENREASRNDRRIVAFRSMKT